MAICKIPISNLDVSGGLDGSELIPVVEGNVTKRSTLSELSGFVDLQYVTDSNSTITNNISTNKTIFAEVLSATEIHSLSSFTNVTDIKIFELSGFTATGDLIVSGDIKASETAISNSLNVDNDTLFIEEGTNKVGINTSNPISGLDVRSGGLKVTGPTVLSGGNVEIVDADPILTIRDSEIDNNNTSSILRLAESGASDTLHHYRDLKFGSDSRFSIGFNNRADTDAEQLVITCSGNVGIGGAVNPNEALTIVGNISATDSLFISNSATIDGNVGIGIDAPERPVHIKTSTTDESGQHPLRIEGASSSIIELKAGDNTSFVGIDFSDNAGPHPGSIIYNHSDNSLALDTNDATRMIILSSGNVGIAVTDPDQKLEVDGNIKISAERFYQMAGNSFQIGIDGAHKCMQFHAGESERLTLLSGGNFGIAVTDPDEKLEVDGNIKIPGDRFYRMSGDAFQIGTDGGGVGMHFHAGGSEKVTLLAGGNLGIGTTTPNEALTVVGTLSTQGLGDFSTLNVDGASETGSINADGNIGISKTGDANINFCSDGTVCYTVGTHTNGFKICGDVEVMNVPYPFLPDSEIKIENNTVICGTANVTDDLKVDTNTLHIDASKNSVGINTLSADEALSIVGNISATGGLSACQDVKFGSVNCSGQVPFSVDVSAHAIGINKDVPAATLHIVNENAASGAGPGEALRVVGSTLLTTNGDTNLTLQGGSSNDDEPLIKIRRCSSPATEGLFGVVGESVAAKGKFVGAIPDAIYIQAQNSATTATSAENIQFAVNEKIGLTIKGSATKDVKVGIGTEAPSEKLTVAERGGPAFILLSSYPASNTQGIKFGGEVTDTDATSSIGELNYYDNSNTTNKLVAQIVTHGVGAALSGDPPNTNAGGQMTFLTKPNSGTLTEVVKITDTGKVGIGTTDPNEALTVVGNVSAQGSTFTSGSANIDGAIMFGTRTSHDTLIVGQADSHNLTFLRGESEAGSVGVDVRYLGAGSGDENIFEIATDGGGSFKMDQSGDIGINTAPIDGVDLTTAKTCITTGLTSSDILLASTTGVRSICVNRSSSGDGGDLKLKSGSSLVGDTNGGNVCILAGGGNDNGLNGHIIIQSGTGASEPAGDLEFKVGSTQALNLTYFESVFNEGSADLDLRVESNNNTSMLHVDAGNDKVGIGTATPNEALTVVGNISATGNISVSGDSVVYGSIYSIWAEEADDISDNANEYSFGNGDDTPSDHGIPIAFKSKLLKISVNVEIASGTTTEDVEIQVYKNGSDTGVKGIVTSGLSSSDTKKSQVTDVSSSNITFDENDLINFRTLKDGNVSMNSVRVAAWLQTIL